MRDRPLESPDALDYRATILLVIAAAILSGKRLLGADLSALMVDYPTWPTEPWRLFTSCLLHGGLFHLVFNLLWTLRFGSVLEPILGWFATTLVLLFLGIGSSAVQWTFSAPGIGLSGIGYGLFGILLALDRHAPAFRGVMSRENALLFGGWFVFCIVADQLGWMPIANWAHAGGLVLGYALGWTLVPERRNRILGTLLTAALTALVALGVTVGRPRLNRSPQRAYELAFEAYHALEAEEDEAALELLLGAIEIEPEWSHPWQNLGVAYQRLGRFDEAQEAYLRAAELEDVEEAERAERAAERRARQLVPGFGSGIGPGPDPDSDSGNE